MIHTHGHEGDRYDPLREFFAPLFDSKTGQLISSAGIKGHLRDAPSTILMARYFPLPSYSGIKVEPSRPDLMPAENIILMGGTSLFLKPQPKSGDPWPPLPVGVTKLGERLGRIDDECCYAFEGGSAVRLVNRLTGASYAARELDEVGRVMDYAVIRRVDRGASEFTVILEGIHEPGTFGATKVATSPHLLGEIVPTVQRAPGYQPTRPIEILVRTIFDPSVNNGVYTVDSIAATPLNIVYDRRWIYDMTGERRWVNQERPAVWIELEGDDPAKVVLPGMPPPPVPYLEVGADLRHLDDDARDVCRALQPGRPCQLGEREGERLLQVVARNSDVFEIVLHEDTELGARRVSSLPERWTVVRSDRRKWVLVLLACRAQDTSFLCNEEQILLLFPDFSRRLGRAGEALVRAFISSINGKVRSGFGPLFESPRGEKNYVRIENRGKRTYRLRLNRLKVRVKLWL